MKSSEEGKALIKKYEGCRLQAYKPIASEENWTIGWGHHDENISQGMTITQQRADELFEEDLIIHESYVNRILVHFNHNQFDALVSFSFNCGYENLQRLCSGGTIASISKWLTAYNQAGGKVVEGLKRRRAEEKALFDKVSAGQITTMFVAADKLNIREKASIDSKVLGVLTKNQPVQVVLIDQHNWAKIQYEDTIVYVSSIYLKN